MAGVNKVILIGNLGKDPELRYTQSGQAVVNFSLATNESWTDKSGERVEKTEWHRIVAWAKTAALCAQYLSKGRTVYIEGKLQTRDWEDKEGVKRQTTEIVAATVQFLGGQRGEAGAVGGATPGETTGEPDGATPGETTGEPDGAMAGDHAGSSDGTGTSSPPPSSSEIPF